MTRQNAKIREHQPTPVATWVGLALWGLALMWWSIYYAQWEGAFGLMKRKLPCFTGATSDCIFYQEQIGKISSIPTYSPIFWWAGCVAITVGYMYRRSRSMSKVDR